MKALILAMVVGLMGASAFADGNTVVLSEKTVDLDVNVSTEGIILSSAGYSRPLVKALIPGLADVTIMNHRNDFAGAPCVSTLGTSNPDDVIQNRPRYETVSFKITLTKSLSVDAQNKVCKVELFEAVEGQIRGYTFKHERSQAMPDRQLEDCR